MAKLNAPLFAFKAVGTLAKSLTVRNRNGLTIAETKPIPKDAKTSNQLAWRTMYHLATQLWHDLTLAEKAVWETLARPRHMTGYAYFMSQALRPNPGIYLPLLGGTMQGDIDMANHGLLNLPLPNILSHGSRHTWPYEDGINARLLLLRLRTHVCNDWRTMDAWTSYATGSGSLNWQSITEAQLLTGATINSHSALYTGVAASISPQVSNRPLFFHIQNSSSALTASEIRLYALRTGAAMPPTDTGHHIGFKIINGEIWATNGDNVTENKTDTGVSIASAYAEIDLTIIGTGGTSIAYYVNGVLKATHTTNIPPNYSYRLWLGHYNTAALAQTIRIYQVNVFGG